MSDPRDTTPSAGGSWRRDPETGELSRDIPETTPPAPPAPAAVEEAPE